MELADAMRTQNACRYYRPRRLGVAWTERGPVTVERNAAYEPDGGQRPVKYLSLDESGSGASTICWG